MNYTQYPPSNIMQPNIANLGQIGVWLIVIVSKSHFPQQRTQQEFLTLEKLYKSAKAEIQQLKEKKVELQEQYNKSHALANKMNLEYTKQFELSNKLMEIIQSTLPHLPPQVHLFHFSV